MAVNKSGQCQKHKPLYFGKSSFAPLISENEVMSTTKAKAELST